MKKINFLSTPKISEMDKEELEIEMLRIKANIFELHQIILNKRVRIYEVKKRLNELKKGK